ncbi:MAG: response regulator [Burkholderiales bacterium]|nr:response regulator [Burkholderiales bacterium]
MNNIKTALIVDDSRVSRMMSRQFVLSARPDWQIEEAGTGEEAIEKVQNFTPVLILLDVNMPGMGGLAAAEKLRQMLPDVRIAMLTANVQDATRNRATALGVGFVEKPVTEHRIHALLDGLEA